MVHARAGEDRVYPSFYPTPYDLTRVANEITPTLKVRRKIDSARYKDLLESLYD